MSSNDSEQKVTNLLEFLLHRRGGPRFPHENEHAANEILTEVRRLLTELSEAVDHIHTVWTIGYQADEARAEAIDAWIARNGHLMSDEVPDEGPK